VPHLGDITVDVRMVENNRSVDDLNRLVSALRRFRNQPPIANDGKLRISFNSVQFMPNAVNVGFFDNVPWDIRAQALNFTRYGISLPPDSVDEFHSYGFPHRIRSDCELTHFFEHVWYVLKPGGTCHFRATNLLELMQRCLDVRGHDNALHMVERQIFTGQDRSGLYFNQASLSRARIISRMRHSGFLGIDITEDEVPDSASLPHEADQIWLREFTPEQIEESLSGRFCVMGGCKNRRWTKLYRPTELSMYCKRHFRIAHRKYISRLNRRLSIQWSATKAFGSDKPPASDDTESCTIPELTPIWRGARTSLGTATATVRMTPVDESACTPESLCDMVNAARDFRRLPPLGDGFRVSYNSDRFIPECVNIGNITVSWPWDVVAAHIDLGQDRLAIPASSTDEFHCYGYAQRLSENGLQGLARSVYDCLKPYAEFRGTVNNLHAAKQRFLQANGLSDPILANQCLEKSLFGPKEIQFLLESVGFAMIEVRYGGKYESTEDILLPDADPDIHAATRFCTSTSSSACCVSGCEAARYHPKDGRNFPSVYCRRHFTQVARILHADLAQKAVVHFVAVKKYRFERGRRIKIRAL